MSVKNLKDIINYAAKTHGDNVAYRYKVKKEIQEKTYNELHKDSMAVSRILEAFGLKGKHIALIGPTTYTWISSYFGITNSASVAVPIDVQLPAEAICELLNRADVEMLIFDEIRKDVVVQVKEKCPQIQKIVSMQAEEEADGILSWKKLVAENQGEYDTEVDPEQLCTILFTSGTTGVSKGVMLCHRNLTENATCLDMKIPAGTVSMTLLPINHVYCLTMDIIKGIYIGVVSCINDSIMHVQKNMKLYQPEMILLVPLVIESIYAKLKAAGNLLPKKVIAKQAFGGNLKTICSGGAYLDPEYIDRFAEYGITVLQGYGMTECSPVISDNTPEEFKPGSVGKPLDNVEIKFENDEILVRGSSVMAGYLDMPEETAETLKDGWLHTGDMGTRTADGTIFIKGRSKTMILSSNGQNIYPEEIESKLNNMPYVAESLVVERNNRLVALVYPDYEAMDANGIGAYQLREVMEQVRIDLNKLVAPYEKIEKIQLIANEFEKTPKRSIKRYLYTN